MHPLARDAVRIYRQDGAAEVLRRTVSRVRRTYLSEIRLRLVPPLPPVRVVYSVRGKRVQFAVTTAEELRRFLSPDGITESPVHSDLIERLSSDDVFYDVGANIGIYACLAASVVRPGTGRVLAFEPLPLNVESLRRNARLNEAPIDVFDFALSDENTSHGFNEDEDGTAGEGQGRLASNENTERASKTIETYRGDNLIADDGVEPPTAIKIDVEGAEMKVIRGLSDALAAPPCRLVYCEVHDHARRGPNDSDIRDFGDQPGEVRETLESMGYDVDRILDRNTPIRKGYVLRGTK